MSEPTNPGDAPTLTDAERMAYTEIITIAAKLVRGDGCLSEYREDHDGMITKATLRSIAAQNDQFKEWAMRLRRAGDTLRVGAASRCPPRACDHKWSARWQQSMERGEVRWKECDYCGEKR